MSIVSLDFFKKSHPYSVRVAFFVCDATMPITIKNEIVHYSKSVRLNKNLSGNDDDWLVWWHCGFYQNRNESQPHVLVAFRKFVSTNTVSDDIIWRRIPLTAMGQVQVGYIFNHSMCKTKVEYSTYKPIVDFTKDSWRFTSFYDAYKDKKELPYPQLIYPPHYSRDQNWLLEFPLNTGGKLIVPCIDFFLRCYGCSAELRRILATYPWCGSENPQKSRFYAYQSNPEIKGTWQVKLKPRLANGDATFLAHAKYDNYTQNIAKNIYAQLESNFDPNGKKPAFIKISPWFEGLAQLKVEGICFDEGRSFLTLRITGCSDPNGVIIFRDRDKSNITNKITDGEFEKKECAQNRIINKLPDIINLTDNDPDRNSGTIFVQDSDFEKLGVPRTIIDRKRKTRERDTGARVKDLETPEFSGGEPYGTGKGIGQILISSGSTQESYGMLKDMWNALLFLKNENPETIQSVNWFTFDHGFKNNNELQLLGLLPLFKKDVESYLNNEVEKDAGKSNVINAILNWPYFDPAKKVLRGVLLVRVIIKGESVYLFEIQRRLRKKHHENGKTETVEESYRGLVFKLDDDNDLNNWIRELISGIRYKKGRVNKVTGICPGMADVYNHSASKEEKKPCVATVMNALRKVGAM